jgi:hypothetical protein
MQQACLPEDHSILSAIIKVLSAPDQAQCACVSVTWRDAAATARATIECNPLTAARRDSVCKYLENHPGCVNELILCEELLWSPRLSVLLPWASLSKLKVLVVSNVHFEQFQPDLVQLPELEQLKLAKCSLYSCSCLVQLAASTKLTSLHVDCHTKYRFTEDGSSSSQLLQPLQQLVELELLADDLPTTATGLQHIADMQGLQQLMLKVDLEDSCSTPLPSSITKLVLQHCDHEECPKLPPALLQHLSNLQQLQLTYFDVSDKAFDSAQQLQQLKLQHCNLSVEALSSVPPSQLQHLDMLDCGVPAAGDGDALLGMVKGLTRLQSLVTYDTYIGVGQFQSLSALTASAHLTRLQLTTGLGGSPPLLPGSVQDMFKAADGQQLQLQHLTISSEEDDWCVYANDLLAIGTSCPALCTLDLSGAIDPSTDLSPLTQFTACRQLTLAGEAINDAAASVVAQLTALVSLRLYSCPELTDLGLAELTALTQLTRLIVTDCDQIDCLDDEDEEDGCMDLLCSSDEDVSKSARVHCGACRLVEEPSWR